MLQTSFEDFDSCFRWFVVNSSLQFLAASEHPTECRSYDTLRSFALLMMLCCLQPSVEQVVAATSCMQCRRQRGQHISSALRNAQSSVRIGRLRACAKFIQQWGWRARRVRAQIPVLIAHRSVFL